MTGGAIFMLIFGCLVLYGGLYITLRRAMKNRERKEEKE